MERYLLGGKRPKLTSDESSDTIHEGVKVEVK